MGSVNLTKQTVNLSKGQTINLSKTSTSKDGLKKVMVGLGWDPAESTETKQYVKQPGFFGKLFGMQPEIITCTCNSPANSIDCDAWLVLVDNNGRIMTENIVYYGRLEYLFNGSNVIKHHGDNLTGDGDGDDEEITIKLNKLPDNISKIIIGVTIYRGNERNQTFDLIKNTFVRIVDTEDNFEICRFDQKSIEENSMSTTFIAGELVKVDNAWEFKALGYGTKDDSISDAVRNLKC